MATLIRLLQQKKARAIDNDQRQHSIVQVHIITQSASLSQTQKKWLLPSCAFIDGLSYLHTLYNRSSKVKTSEKTLSYVT